MRTSTVFLFGLAALATASPYPRQSTDPTNFLLVTTSQCPATNSSSTLSDVSATSLFDPNYQPNYLLRTIEPGYGSLPRFNFTNGELASMAAGPHGVGVFVYSSTGEVTGGEELEFSQDVEPNGNLGLKNGYLLTVSGEEEGWTLCDGQLEEEMLYWKGTDASCRPTYVHAVQDAPY